MAYELPGRGKMQAMGGAINANGGGLPPKNTDKTKLFWMGAPGAHSLKKGERGGGKKKRLKYPAKRTLGF